MAKNSPGASATAAQLDALESTRPAAPSDSAAHAASTPILGANGMMALKTDADVHAEHAQRTPKVVYVDPGDVIVHYTSRGRWFKGDETMKLNPDRNIMGRCEKAFVYQDGVGALYHEVRYTPVRRFLKPKQDRATGATIPGGDIPVINPDAKRLLQSATPDGTYNPRAMSFA